MDLSPSSSSLYMLATCCGIGGGVPLICLILDIASRALSRDCGGCHAGARARVRISAGDQSDALTPWSATPKAAHPKSAKVVLALLWQIYSCRCLLQIHFRQCGHRRGGSRAMSSRMAWRTAGRVGWGGGPLILFFPPCCCEAAMLEEGVRDHRHERMTV